LVQEQIEVFKGDRAGNVADELPVTLSAWASSHRYSQFVENRHQGRSQSVVVAIAYFIIRVNAEFLHVSCHEADE
jgi:hypothetical protein